MNLRLTGKELEEAIVLFAMRKANVSALEVEEADVAIMAGGKQHDPSAVCAVVQLRLRRKRASAVKRKEA